MATLAMLDDIPSKIGHYGRELSPLTFAAGFVYGATVDIGYGTVAGNSFATPLQRVSDTIARVSGFQVNLGGGSTKSSQLRKLKPSNILNNGTFGALFLEGVYEATHNKWAKLAKDVFQPPLAGYGIGKIFDDPIASSSSALTGFSGSAYPVANYNTSARNNLPVGGAVWTT